MRTGEGAAEAPFTFTAAPAAPHAPAAAYPVLQPLLAPSLERRRVQSHLLHMGGDICAILAGFSAFGYAYDSATGFSFAMLGAQLILPIFLTIALYNGTYSIASLKNPGTGIGRALLALAIALAAVLFFAFMTKSSEQLSRANMAGGLLSAAFVMTALRLQMRHVVRRCVGDNVTNTLVIEDGGPRLEVDGAIRLDAAASGLRPDLGDPHAVARFGQMLVNMDRVIVTCPKERRGHWAMLLKGANVAGEVLDDDVVQLGALGARVHDDHGLLLVSTGPLGLRARAIKRVFDLVVAGSALVVLAPLLALAALAIRLEDGGPVFFVQRRMGRGNRFFDIYKFRSMRVERADSNGNVSASRNDERVTRIGRLIRSTSIDELPQLLNVLRGDMSLVGPRPHAIGSQAGDKLFWEVDSRYWQRHSLKPGLSGLAQVRGFRGATERETDLVNRLRSDLEYLEGWTLWRDIKILCLTARVLVHDRAF